MGWIKNAINTLKWMELAKFVFDMIVAIGSWKLVRKALSYVPHISSDWASVLAWFAAAGVLYALISWQDKKYSSRPAWTSGKKPQEPSKLVIHWAKYRAVENSGEICDVGDVLRQIIFGDSLVFDIENDNFVIGDKKILPDDFLSGKEKRLQVNYSYGGGQRATTERREHGRLLLPEDSKIKWLAGENQRLANEVQRLTPAAPKIGELSFRVVDEVAAEGFPLKLRMQFRNDSATAIDVQLRDYRPELITLKSFPTEVIQVRLRDLWYPRDHTVGRIALYPGQQFQIWIAPDESKFNKAQVELHRGRIGTLVFQVDGQNLEIKL